MRAKAATMSATGGVYGRNFGNYSRKLGVVGAHTRNRERAGGSFETPRLSTEAYDLSAVDLGLSARALDLLGAFVESPRLSAVACGLSAVACGLSAVD